MGRRGKMICRNAEDKEKKGTAWGVRDIKGWFLAIDRVGRVAAADKMLGTKKDFFISPKGGPGRGVRGKVKEKPLWGRIVKKNEHC